MSESERREIRTAGNLRQILEQLVNDGRTVSFFVFRLDCMAKVDLKYDIVRLDHERRTVAGPHWPEKDASFVKHATDPARWLSRSS
jgi:hypothetical protein